MTQEEPNKKAYPTAYNSIVHDIAMMQNVVPMYHGLIINPDGVCSFHKVLSQSDLEFDVIRYVMGLELDDTLAIAEAANLTAVADVSIIYFCDENGIAKKLAENPAATVFAGQPVYGPALFFNTAVMHFFDEGVSEEEMKEVLDAQADEQEMHNDAMNQLNAARSS